MGATAGRHGYFCLFPGVSVGRPRQCWASTAPSVCDGCHRVATDALPRVTSARHRLAVAAVAAVAVGAAAASPASATARSAIAAGAPRTTQVVAAPALQTLRSDRASGTFLDGSVQAYQQVQSTAAISYARHHRRTPREIARRMLRARGWSWHQFRYLNRLWDRESGWNVHASNPYSGAYRIPQAVPGSKMASAGSNWRWSARTQIRWGLRYIRAVYGSPRRAWYHELSTAGTDRPATGSSARPVAEQDR